MGSGTEVSHEVALSESNTFRFLPGAMDGVSCPCCFRDLLVREVIERGACTGCEASLELRLVSECAE
ncbi:hypothetical protein [Halomarina ordinaria]|uniref:CopG family transcriptional regulator n=1 Tax=Halomarina ordinaria TaxID=3033939 RepID=A0ABD5U432_9EURY|nr:hypothetical protein [Halomarina sp. PSRA2]